MYTVPFVERTITSVMRTVPPSERTLVICTVPPVERISVLVRTFTLVIGTVPLLRGHLHVCTSVGVSGSWFPRREISCYSFSRSLQVPARRLEAPAVEISGS
jgi:hypothetical protein